jgi:hypothetical protein
MPLLSGNYNPIAGPLIQVAILPPQFGLVAPQGPGAIPAPQEAPTDVKFYMGLIDTGASCTCITQKIVQDVGLQPIGKSPMSGATGLKDVDQYLFAVGFMLNARPEPTGTISGNLTLMQVHGCEFSDHAFGFDVLIGRDIICKGSFTLSFDGHWLLAF